MTRTFIDRYGHQMEVGPPVFLDQIENPNEVYCFCEECDNNSHFTPYSPKSHSEGLIGPEEHPDICRDCGKYGGWRMDDNRASDPTLCQCPPTGVCEKCQEVRVILDGSTISNEFGHYTHFQFDCGHDFWDVDEYPMSHFA